MAEHTPRPWVVASEVEARVQRIVGKNHQGSTLVAKCEHHLANSLAENKANARLISAAPDLLLALQSLTDPEGHIWHGHSGECTGECKAVQAAIRKATGETP